MVIRTLLRSGRLTEDRLRGLLHLNDSEARRRADAQDFWTRAPEQQGAVWWHYRDSFGDDARWLRIGARHFDLFEKFAAMASMKRPLNHVVEWGCGGGANAVHFAREAQHFHGVDISGPSLDECGKQMAAIPSCQFHPIQIDASNPDGARAKITEPVDLFLSTYVFELLPSAEYGDQVLRIAHDLLRDGGMAMIQIKYQTLDWRTRARRWGYKRGVANMTTYMIDEFWQRSEKCGFKPLAVHILPQPEEVPDERYAYFCLVK